MPKPKSQLEYFRKINFLTQGEVAELLGITTSHYNKIERGARGLSLNMALKLKKIYKVQNIENLLEDVG